MSASPSASSNGGSRSPTRPLDPISRTALRYTISPREYELLHEYLISRAPKRVQERAPAPARFSKLTGETTPNNKSTKDGSGGLDNNATAMRSALRTFLVVYLGFKSYEAVVEKIAERRGGARKVEQGKVMVRFGTARVALSYSMILLFHKLLHRFFRRLRASLLEDNAVAFRKRNPRTTSILTSRYTPAVGASLSGFFLGVSPADQLRMTIAIYVFTRSLEFGFNALELGGYLWRTKEEGGEGRPWWFGSWMLMPFACGQLLHAFVFDRDCFPAAYGNFILQRSTAYVQQRVPNYPKDQPWPTSFEVIDGLAEISKLHWPPFTSPILVPGNSPLPSNLTKLSPVISPAHPGLRHTSCALLHPTDPSCTRTYLRHFLLSFPSVAKFFTLLYGAFALLSYRSLLKTPLPFLNKLAERILRMALFITAAIGSSWASICFFNNYFSRSFLPTQRWFLGGFVGGLWAFVARGKERANFLYSARLSVDSLWKVGRKRGWWRGWRNGDVLLFAASLALVDLVYEVRPGAVQGAMVRRAMGVLRGEGALDRAEEGKQKAGGEEEEGNVLGEKSKDE